jgi:hypothetical protein
LPRAGNHLYVAEVLNQVVAFAVIQAVADPRNLYECFDVEAFTTRRSPVAMGSRTVGMVKHIVINPLFERQTRFFTREIMRISGFDQLFFMCDPPGGEADAISRKAAIREFAALRRRRP